MSSQKTCRWKASFVVNPPVKVSGIKDLPDIKLKTKTEGNQTHIIGIEITTPDQQFVDALNHATLVANRCTDYLTLICGFGVATNITQINEIGKPEDLKNGAAFLKADLVISRVKEIDLTNSRFLDILNLKDDRLARQLSHYRRGIASRDIIERIREYYLVIEDEYPSDHPFLERYKYVRHLVSHPELNAAKSADEARRLLGKTYFDPSVPQDLAALERNLADIKDTATKIIEAKKII
jgi:hypothetical protein